MSAATVARLDAPAPDARRGARVDAAQRPVRRRAVPRPSRSASASRAIVDESDAGRDAVRELNDRFGGGLPDGRLVLGRGELTAARDALEPDVRQALDQAIAHVRRFAETQRPATTTHDDRPGVEIERRWTPISSVGCYVPGGAGAAPLLARDDGRPCAGGGRRAHRRRFPGRAATAASTRSCSAPPACSASTSCSSRAAPRPSRALAFGLPDVGLERVDRIVGPGSVWVTAAKLELAGDVGIDLPAGPTEGLVLADATADPDLVAADLLTQAEHGPDSPAILVTTSAELADAVEQAIADRVARAPRQAHPRALARAPRRHRARARSRRRNRLRERVRPRAPLGRARGRGPRAGRRPLRNAGSLFVGRWAPESAGDYATGANHVLPTGGLARASGRSTSTTYGKFIQVQRLTREGLAALAETITTLADAEGLDAHADAVRTRLEPRSAEMSPTPVTYSLPTAPAVYTWEATNEAVAERYGLPGRGHRPLRPQHPAPAAGVALARARARPRDRRSRRRSPSTHRPTTGACPRPRPPPTAWPATRCSSGAGADEVLDMTAKAFLPRGRWPRRGADPHLFHVPRRQRAARRDGRARATAARSGGAGRSTSTAMRAAARDATLVWLCNPNNPTGLAEPPGADGGAPPGLAADAAADARTAAGRRRRRGLRRVRGRDRAAAAARVPEPRRHPHREQGLRPGRAAGRLRARARARPSSYRALPAARLRRHDLDHDRRAGAARPGLAPRERRADARGARPAGGRDDGPRLAPRPSVANFILVDFGTPSPRRARRRGTAPPRASCPGRSHPGTRSTRPSGSPSGTRPRMRACWRRPRRSRRRSRRTPA